MIFQATKIEGVFVVEPVLIQDERGFFAVSWSRREFEERSLNLQLVQCNISFNHRRGTLRGMHYQLAPYEETKLVRCTRGAMFLFYIPKGMAHGFQTLTDDTYVFYQMSEYYHPESARGVRWDDPAFAIDGPLPPTVMAERDANYPMLVRKPDLV